VIPTEHSDSSQQKRDGRHDGQERARYSQRDHQQSHKNFQLAPQYFCQAVLSSEVEQAARLWVLIVTLSAHEQAGSPL
jgi:hypothetical protein